MRRRTLLATFLTTLLATLGVAPAALADSAPPPPPPLLVQGVDGVFSAGAGPSQATYVLDNRSPLAAEVFLDRVIYRDGRYNIPLAIERATRADGSALGRRFTVPPNGSVRCVVYFEEARGRGQRFPLTLRLRMAGRRIEGTATVRRGHRTPTKTVRRKGA